MESKDDRLLSHYLWSLDNALSGLIELCNNKPETADVIINQVEDKLNVWNKHTKNITITSNTATVAWGDCSDEDDNDDNIKKESEDEEEEEKETTSSAKDDLDAAWGDCSDEDDDEMDSFMLSEATGLCKLSANDDKKEEEEDDINDVETEEVEEKEVVNKDDDDIKKEEVDKNEEADETMAEIENILSGPLFIDDTQINKTVQKEEENTNKLTWAQRTKKSNVNNDDDDVNNVNYFVANNVNNKFSKKNRAKKEGKKESKKRAKLKEFYNIKKDDGWSRVYRSKKKKMQRRNATHGKNKTQQQRLSEAEEKKRAQILQRQQKHAEIFEHFNQKLFEKEVNEKKSILEKKKASRERLKKAEEKRKKTDLLRKEKAIKDDVRREEIRIFREWQQREKKSAIVEKQVAAEIRKLKIAQKLTQKLSNTEERVKNIKKAAVKQQKKQKYSNKKVAKSSKQNTPSRKMKKKKMTASPPKNTVSKKYIDDDDGDKISNEDNKYFDCDIIADGMSKYFAIPALNLVSRAVRDEMHHFYAKTNKLNVAKLEEALAKLLKTCGAIHFNDIHFNNDVLLAVNRLTKFDVNNKLISFKCSKLLIDCLVLFTVNRIGCRLLSSAYLDKLLTFFKLCINEYIFKHNDAYQSILAQCCLIFTRLFNEMLRQNNENSENLFVAHSVRKYLFSIYNAKIFGVICSVFKSITICNESLCSLIFDGFVAILIPIIAILDEAHFNQIEIAIARQLNETKCCGILNFMSKLVFFENPINENQQVAKLSRESVILLNECIACLNGICKIDLQMVQNHVLEYEMEIYHIFIILLQFTCRNFMKHQVFKHERNRKRAQNSEFEKEIFSIRELCKGLLEFITFCARNNVEIQDMFRFISCNKATLIKQLTQFPFFFFINNEGKLSLFPTLIAITQSNRENLDILKQTLNTKLIKKWIKQNIFEVLKNEDANHHSAFVQKVPVKIWANCLQIY